MAHYRMRSEHFERLRRGLELQHHTLATAHEGVAAALAKYDVAKPWNEVFRLAIKDKDYWDREVNDPAIKLLNSAALGLTGGVDKNSNPLDGTAQPYLHHQSGQQQGSGKRRAMQPPPARWLEGGSNKRTRRNDPPANLVQNKADACPDYNSANGYSAAQCTKTHACSHCGHVNHNIMVCRNKLNGGKSGGKGRKGGKGNKSRK